MKSVVLVTVDSLRADHCGYVGREGSATPALDGLPYRSLTPTLDAMADRGTAYTNAVAPGPSTPESMPAVFTGSHPVVRDDGDSLLERRRRTIRRHLRARRTLAERFAERGYDTAGFSPNPYTSRYFGFDAGFDRYEDFVEGSRERLYDGALDGALRGTPLSALFPARVLLNWVQREEVFKPWEDFYGEVTGWVDGASEPYFLWVLLMDAHDPYLVPDDHRSQPRTATYRANWRLWRQGHEPPIDGETRRRLVRSYRDAVGYADAFLARLRSFLPGDPVVCVHADHGEAFGEHGTYGHQQRLYEENVHVPLVVDGGPDRTVDRPVSLEAVPDILASLADGDPPALPDGPARSRTLEGDRRAVRIGDWKYAASPGARALFDLAADPGEETDRSDDRPELVDACDGLLEQWQSDDAERRGLAAAADAVAEEFRL